MIIEYNINEKDYLDYQLYAASKSDRIKKKRQKNKILLPILYFAFGLLFIYQNKIILAVLFLIIAILWYFLYPIFEKHRYIRHYKGYITETFKTRLGRTVIFQFDNDCIFAKDNGSESKVQTTEIEEITEIESAIFIKLKTGQSFVLPKDKIDIINDVKIKLKELATNLNVKYNIDDKWEWK